LGEKNFGSIIMHVPKVLEIKRIIQETETVKTFIFDWKWIKYPGQFMMVWNFKMKNPCPSL
jgi:dihydroorotate dehydrogenase electron transfer subunit